LKAFAADGEEFPDTAHTKLEPEADDGEPEDSLPRGRPEGEAAGEALLDSEVDADMYSLHEFIAAARRSKERAGLLAEDLRAKVGELSSAEPMLELILLRQGISALAHGGQLAELTANELGGRISTLQRRIVTLEEQRSSAAAVELDLQRKVEGLKEELKAMEARSETWRRLPHAPRGLFLCRPIPLCQKCGGWAPQELDMMERIVERCIEVECPVPGSIVERRALADKTSVARVHRAVQAEPVSGELTVKALLTESAGQPEKLRVPERLRGLVEETRSLSTMDLSQPRESSSSGLISEGQSQAHSQVLPQEQDETLRPRCATGWTQMQAVTRERDEALEKRCGEAESRCDQLWRALQEERSSSKAARLQLEVLVRERDEALSRLPGRETPCSEAPWAWSQHLAERANHC